MQTHHSRQLNKQNLFICEVLRNGKVVDFVKNTLVQGYIENMPEHETEIREMLTQAFELLVKSQEKSISIARLRRTAIHINHDLFHRGDDTYWFHQLYSHYKYVVRPELDYTRIAPYLHGKKILDFGSGGGYLALKMSTNGYEVSTTDVLDYRVADAKVLPFKKMVDPDRIPYPDNSFDTVIVKTVLHHISDGNVLTILDELRRVATRVIIEEDVYGLDAADPDVSALIKTQPLMKEYMQLSIEHQFQSLMLTDYFANAVAYGIVDMNFPFGYKTVEEWERILERHQFTVKEVTLKGFETGKFTKNCQSWFICDRKE